MGDRTHHVCARGGVQADAVLSSQPDALSDGARVRPEHDDWGERATRGHGAQLLQEFYRALVRQLRPDEQAIGHSSARGNQRVSSRRALLELVDAGVFCEQRTELLAIALGPAYDQ